MKICQTHNKELRAGKNGSFYCASRMPDGSWCPTREYAERPKTPETANDRLVRELEKINQQLTGIRNILKENGSVNSITTGNVEPDWDEINAALPRSEN